MNKKIKTTLLAGLTAIAAVAVFTLSVNDSSLESLGAEATGTKCVQTTNCDCESPSTGTIYNGYKLKNVGSISELEP